MKKAEFGAELRHIIDFWHNLRDDENGGFIGYMDNDHVTDPKADKGVILHSRILWFFSNAYMQLGEPALLEDARHAYEFLTRFAVDKEYGGVYWAVKYNGDASEDIKHTYCQAFFIYALASYYRASGNTEALKLAYDVFSRVEMHCTDSIGYLEKLSRDWQVELPNDELSENGLMADKTMNTALHLMEAYTELYIADKNDKVADRLRFILKLTEDRIFDPAGNKLLVFFDRSMDVIGDVHSYGHDIEATWLADRACDALGDKAVSARYAAMNARITQNIAEKAFDTATGSLLNESDKGVVNRLRVWWVQAESVVGFMNATQRGYGDYSEICERIWAFIKEHIIDKREGGEWFSQLLDSGEFDAAKPMVDPWKCPYHNGRMCLEMMARLEE